jgi:ABC-2 type transport system permease protein
MWERVSVIIRKELRQVLRDPRLRVMLFVPPMVQLIIFGFAVNLDVENGRIAWMDLDRTPASRELRAAFEGSRYFSIVATPESDDELHRLMDRGAIAAAVRILPGFAADLARRRQPQVQVLVEGTNSNTASIVSNYAVNVIRRFPGAGRPALISTEARVWFNSALKSRNYFVPGVVVNIVALVTVILTSLSIVREKEIGTMEQLMVTPLRSFELMLGKMLPFAAVGMIQVVLVVSVALAVFQVSFRGSALLLAACACLFLLTTLGAGLFISTISRTQQQAVMSTFFFFMPAFMLSGFAFPIRNMPLPVQYLSYLDPLRYFVEIVRGIFLKGSGVDVLWPQMVALFVFGALVLGFSALRFQKRLD